MSLPITSLHNPLIKHLIKLRLDSVYRYEQQAVVLEGTKLLQEGQFLIKKLLRVKPDLLPHLRAVEEGIVTEAVMRKISGVSSPEGIVAEVQMPPFSSLNKAKWVLALDGINDPGNLGTLLRTALALGWEGIYLLPNNCDPFNEKVLRAAKGAHFKLPLRMGNSEELQTLVKTNQLMPIVADIQGAAPSRFSESQGILLVLGNEAHGTSTEVRRFCASVTIPMPGEMESLNVAVAGGILMYLLKTGKK